ncbi:DNA topoisomerase IB [Bradyrhizobium sp. CCBAU 53415]|uniref:DNA topoisomerase IB n=1 Tax=Bradyrhizobium sp. CCBAU 53415 TaxID=1325119 RepID=UPI002304F05A|nr:DNA topoisomerase IB [Bradyrhizobium sp. CCBAU 53415]
MEPPALAGAGILRGLLICIYDPPRRTEPTAVFIPLERWSLDPRVLPRDRPMLRETRNEEQVLDRTAEVAATIAEEGLRYVSDSAPGYTRKRTGTTFSYYDKDGNRITDAAVVRRIKSIGIPPAYESVWICPSANGHIQATGLDARGRKQYRYHAKWRELRDQNKYEHIVQFAAALPALRDRVAADMKLEGLPREKVLATIVSLLEKTLIRVGNAEYAEKNKSYGLTTMRRKHVAVGRGVLRFDFTGKSGKQWKLRVEDKRIAAIVKRCAEIPGHELFKYLDDDGQPRTVDSGDVNAYIKDITGEDFSAKDFRTWAGTVLAALALTEFKKYDSQAEAKRNVVAAIESVSKQLGNTPAICRKCYVHPEVLNAYMSGDLLKMIEAKIAQKFKRQYAKLTSDEIMVLAFLRKRLDSLKALA